MARAVNVGSTVIDSGCAEQADDGQGVAGDHVDYDPTAPAASVEVWAMTLVGVGDAGGAVFTTSTVDLIGEARTWTVTGLDTVEGPTPMVSASASAPGRTRALLRDAAATLPLPLPPMGHQR